MNEPIQSEVTIYGVKVDEDGNVVDQWEHVGLPITIRGIHIGYSVEVNGDGSVTAESEQGHVHAIDIARKMLHHAGEGHL